MWIHSTDLGGLSPGGGRVLSTEYVHIRLSGCALSPWLVNSASLMCDMSRWPRRIAISFLGTDLQNFLYDGSGVAIFFVGSKSVIIFFLGWEAKVLHYRKCYSFLFWFEKCCIFFSFEKGYNFSGLQKCCNFLFGYMMWTQVGTTKRLLGTWYKLKDILKKTRYREKWWRKLGLLFFRISVDYPISSWLFGSWLI